MAKSQALRRAERLVRELESAISAANRKKTELERLRGKSPGRRVRREVHSAKLADDDAKIKVQANIITTKTAQLPTARQALKRAQAAESGR